MREIFVDRLVHNVYMIVVMIVVLWTGYYICLEVVAVFADRLHIMSICSTSPK